MKSPRLAALLAVAALPLTLTSCSHDAAGDAHTAACRTYLLSVAGQDQVTVRLLARAERSGDWQSGSINYALATVQSATHDAGTTPGLSAADFDTYRALTDALGRAHADANPDEYSVGITKQTVADLSDAVDGVRRTCASA